MSNFDPAFSGQCGCGESVYGQSECDKCSDDTDHEPFCDDCNDKGYTETIRPCSYCQGSGRSKSFKGEACENCAGYEDPDDTIKETCTSCTQ